MRVAAVDNPGYCLVAVPSFSEALESDGSLGGSGAAFCSLSNLYS